MNRTVARIGAWALSVGLSLGLWTSALALQPLPASQSQDGGALPRTPRALFLDLFDAVQNAQVFADNKTFADAVPNSEPAEILAKFHAAKPAGQAALKEFVAANFTLPAAVAVTEQAAHPVLIEQHIDSLWDTLTRSPGTPSKYSSLLNLPEPYVVPGGRFREMYYWDSYFTMLGLVQGGRHDLVEHMVRDFAYLIDTYGHVPNGTRNYYLSRSQPPFFYVMVALLNPDDAAAAYAQYLPQLRREHGFWMQGEVGLRHGTAHRRVVAMPDGAVLNRYCDDANTPREESLREDMALAQRSGRVPQQLYSDLRAAAESGWDFSSRWFADGRDIATINTTQIVPVDLNSLMFGLERAIRAGCERVADRKCVAEFTRRAGSRRKAVDRYLWDGTGKVFRDYRWTERASVPRLSAAILYPLFVGLANEQQAAGVADAAARDLLKPGGIVTTPVASGQQWDSPNGWAPLQWIGISGLRQYSQAALAQGIACRWMQSVNRVYGESGKLVEKYDVVTTGRPGGGGEYPTQDGFGWTNGVMRRLMVLYPAYAGAEAKPCDATEGSRP